MLSSTDDLHRIFIYDPETGKLIWRRRMSGSRGDAIFNSTHAGKEAGSPHEGGYLQVGWKLDGVAYKALVHRVCFAMAHGYWPENVDHENNRRTDNRFENLRDADQPGNNQNRSIVRAKTGFKGVFIHACTQRFFAQIVSNKRTHYLGIFDDPKEAAVAYDAAALRLHGQFARTNASLGLL